MHTYTYNDSERAGEGTYQLLLFEFLSLPSRSASMLLAAFYALDCKDTANYSDNT